MVVRRADYYLEGWEVACLESEGMIEEEAPDNYCLDYIVVGSALAAALLCTSLV